MPPSAMGSPNQKRAPSSPEFLSPRVTQSTFLNAKQYRGAGTGGAGGAIAPPIFAILA